MANALVPPQKPNPLIPPMDPAAMAQMGVTNPFAAPVDPAPSPSLGFQAWASDPRNAMKVSHAMTSPDAPLQPNAGKQRNMPALDTSALDNFGAKGRSANPWVPPARSGGSPGEVMPPAAAATPAATAGVAAPVVKPAAAAPAIDTSAFDNYQRQISADQDRLRSLQQSGAGLNRIQNPLLRGLAKAGDIVAPFLIGGGAAAIPGTTLHNRWLQREQAGRVEADQNALTNELQNSLTRATIAKTQADAAAIPQNAESKRLAANTTLAKLGYKLDENGLPAPDETSPAYQQQQLKNSALQAQAEYLRAGQALRQAQAQLAAAKNDPSSAAYKQAQQRLTIAQQNAAAAQQRASAYMGRYMQSAYNVGLSGDVLPGAIIDDAGEAVGTGNAANVRPTGTQRTKGNMAESADQQIGDMEGIIAKRPDIFGPQAGRTTDFSVWLGSQDPDAQRFRAARTIAADHLAGTFGGRSEAALQALDNAIGQFKDNPAAVKAGLDQLREANRLFMNAGKVRTAGSAGSALRPPKLSYKMTASAPGGQQIGSNDNGQTWFDVKTGRRFQ